MRMRMPPAVPRRDGIGPHGLGNVADWGSGSIQGYNQVLNGGVMESAIGQSYSYESQSWAKMMSSYATIMNALAPSRAVAQLPHFQLRTAAPRTIRGDVTDSHPALLDNGYYTFQYSGFQGGGNGVGWLDEMGVALWCPCSGSKQSRKWTYSTVRSHGVEAGRVAS